MLGLPALEPWIGFEDDKRRVVIYGCESGQEIAVIPIDENFGYATSSGVPSSSLHDAFLHFELDVSMIWSCAALCGCCDCDMDGHTYR